MANSATEEDEEEEVEVAEAAPAPAEEEEEEALRMSPRDARATSASLYRSTSRSSSPAGVVAAALDQLLSFTIGY